MAAITGKLARAAGRALMPGLWNSGLSPNKIYKALRFDYQLSWRRQDMFEDIRAVTGLMKRENLWKGYPTNQKPHRFLFSDTFLPAAQNYRLYANVTIYNELTDEYTDKIISFYTDNITTLDDAMKEYIGFYNQTGSDVHEFIIGYEFRTAEHNRGAPW